MIRRFSRVIRWLARREIAAALELQRVCYQAAFTEAVNSVYLRGHTDGMSDALAQMEAGKCIDVKTVVKRLTH